MNKIKWYYGEKDMKDCYIENGLVYEIGTGYINLDGIPDDYIVGELIEG